MDIDVERLAISLFWSSVIVGAGWLVWNVLLTIDAWFQAKRQTIRSNANMIAPNEVGLLPVARKAIEIDALVQSGYNLVNPAFVRPDARGLLPVNQTLIETNVVAEQALALLMQYVANGRPLPNVPQSISYAPHLITKTDVKAEGGAPLPALPAVAPKSFLELFQGGALPQDKFLMGFDLESGDQVMATWKQLYSALIGGQSGSGKSTLIRSVLAQSALQGGRFVVLDPHYSAGDESLGKSLSPLRSLMLCDVAASEQQMIDALHFVRDTGRRRLQGQDADKTPVVMIVDETTALLSRSGVADELSNVLGMIAQETRKVGVYAMCIGQQFKSDVMNTTVRNSFVSMLSCRARKDVARVMSGNSEFAKEAETLTIGQAVWMQPDGTVTKLAVPNCTEQMIDVVAKTVEKAPKTQPAPVQVVGPVQAPVQTPVQAPVQIVNEGEPETLDSRIVRVKQMFKNGATQSEIIAEVWGIKAKGGKWQQASIDLNSILRSLIPD